MRMVWNAGAAVAVTACLSMTALLNAAPVRPSVPTRSDTLAALSSSLGDAVQERFERANTSQDGRLTFEQARLADWVSVARQFGTIDSAHAGFVTSEQIHAFFQAHRRRGRSDIV